MQKLVSHKGVQQIIKIKYFAPGLNLSVRLVTNNFLFSHQTNKHSGKVSNQISLRLMEVKIKDKFIRGSAYGLSDNSV